MNGFDWNGNDKRDSFDDYMDYEMSSGGSENNNAPSGCSNIGCSGVVVIIAVILLIYFIFTGLSWDGIDTFLIFALLAYLFAKHVLD